MALFQGLFFLFFGVGILIMDYRSLSSGWLPFGPNGFKGRLEINRNDNEMMYWLLFALYAIAGTVLIIFALRVLAGSAAPLPLT
jgi:hypothetical protein